VPATEVDAGRRGGFGHGGPAGQRGGLLVGARCPQAVQQRGHGGRVVEGAWAAARPASAAACSCAPAFPRLSSNQATVPWWSTGA
jgi:hypothetical protein